MAAPSVCILGLGTMGMALARRLREQGFHLGVWNRSPAKAQALAAENASGRCVTAATVEATLALCAERALVIIMVTDTAAVVGILREVGVAAALKGKTLVNLTSGNPDEGRTISSALATVTAAFGGVNFIDGAYCGAPAKARSGTGQLFLSSARAEIVERAKATLSEVGSVTFCGDIGASRAVDYGVVDLFFANLLSFMSNSASLEREGVDMKVFFQEAAKRLATVPAALEAYSKRMTSRDDNAYQSDLTVSLNTARSYWAGRLPYNAAHGIPSQFADLFVQLLDEASGGKGGPHSGADLSRLQEVVRYGDSAGSSSGSVSAGNLEPPAKRTKL